MDVLNFFDGCFHRMRDDQREKTKYSILLTCFVKMVFDLLLSRSRPAGTFFLNDVRHFFSG